MIRSSNSKFEFRSVNYAIFSSNWTMLKFDLLLSHFVPFPSCILEKKGTFCLSFQGKNANRKSFVYCYRIFSFFHASSPSSPFPLRWASPISSSLSQERKKKSQERFLFTLLSKYSDTLPLPPFTDKCGTHRHKRTRYHASQSHTMTADTSHATARSSYFS